MTNSIGPVSALAVLLMSTPASAAAGPSDDCAVLDQLLRTARTEFNALKDKGFGGASCDYRSHEFKCAWGFSTDKYVEAQTQLDRLQRCIAAQPDARLLEKKRGEASFQVNPETTVLVRGPDSNAGTWKIQLKVTTTADWN
jgi:hypothetical protein